MTKITTKDNLDLQALERNKPKTFVLGKKKYKLKRMTNAVSERVDKLVAERETDLGLSGDKKSLLVNLSKNRTLVPKTLSLMILHNWFRVTFFYWIHWRYLNAVYTMNEMLSVYNALNEYDDVTDFFYFTASLQARSRMIKRMSEKNTQTIIQEQQSVQETKP